MPCTAEGTRSLAERHVIPREISDEAARWVADRDAGLLNEANENDLRRWLAADPLHRQAYDRAKMLWTALDDIVETPGMRPQRTFAPPRRRARRWIVRGAPRVGRHKVAVTGIAVCMALVVISVSTDLPMRMQADALTSTGERQLVTLPDGSTIRLNTRSAVAFNYSADARQIRLLRGEAEFSVRSDPARPFTVEAAGGKARALGTRFIVREDGNAATVTVTEHRVRVTYRGKERDVGEGERISYADGAGVTDKQAIEIADAEAWTRGRLSVVNRPLGEVVAELGRYHSGYIHVWPSAAQLKVSGNFRTDRPLEALQKIQAAVDARSTRIANRLIFLYK